MKIALVAASLAFVVGTLVPLLRHDQWWIRIFDFPRVQIAAGGFCVAGLFLFYWETTSTWETALALALLACVAYQAYRVIPYTALARKQVLSQDQNDPGAGVKVLAANVLISNRDSASLLELIREKNPDLIFLVETDDRWELQLQELERDYPFTVKKPLPNTYGMLLYSRLRLLDPVIRFLREEDIPSVRVRVELPGGRWFWLHGLHPAPPYPKYATETTQRDAELLLVGKEVRRRNQAAIVVGDLNDVAWSHTTTLFQKTSGLLDPRIGRGPCNTFHVRYPVVRFPLDHIFVSHHFKLIRLERLRDIGSDHFPVFAHVKYEDGAHLEQERPRAGVDERVEVEEKIETALRQKA